MLIYKDKLKKTHLIISESEPEEPSLHEHDIWKCIYPILKHIRLVEPHPILSREVLLLFPFSR